MRKKVVIGQIECLTHDSKENPRLCTRVIKGGKQSFFLQFYDGYDKETGKKNRKKETIKDLFMWVNPKDTEQRTHNNNALALAQKIREEKKQELSENKGVYIDVSKVNFHTFYEEYMNEYGQKDLRNINLAYSRFNDFLNATPEYKCYKKFISPIQITRDMMEDFVDYLKSRSVGEGARTLFQRFKKVYKACAVKYNISYQKPFMTDRGKIISIPILEGRIKRDTLTPQEERQLMETHYMGENTQIRNAFLFCLHTGMRFCDVKTLTFSAFDFKDNTMRWEQNKTKGHSAHSEVVQPITKIVKALVGEPRGGNDLVFDLPSHTMCLKALRHWVKRAGIDKHITWHCARHSFGSNMAEVVAQKQLPTMIIKELMGHSSFRYTEIYVHMNDARKKQAVSALEDMVQGDID